jgi:MoaA/NifB/PqqE/SkfB family radical SAM enzyme
MKGAGVRIKISEDGCLKIPDRLAEEYGLLAGAEVVLEKGTGGLRISNPVSHLARVYVEPTSSCGLRCRTCVRSVWDEPPGFMDGAVFKKLVKDLETIQPKPSVFFGGFGEPLSHPAILEMVKQVKEGGIQVELITNGVLLKEEISAGLLEADLDVLWVSIDGVRPESYAGIRLGVELSQVIQNLERFVEARESLGKVKPRLGLAFVAMQSNIEDLPALLDLGSRLSASFVSVSSLLPHTPEMAGEVLHRNSLFSGGLQVSPGVLQVSLPRMDMEGRTLAALGQALQGRHRVFLAGSDLSQSINRCPFVSKGSTSIRWDGSVSPCLPLLHTHSSYLDDRFRSSEAYLVGSLWEKSLLELWHDPGYTALRERLQDFDFSPCTFCNSCDMAGNTTEDCFGNEAPTCGSCLWAQGIIQCP